MKSSLHKQTLTRVFSWLILLSLLSISLGGFATPVARAQDGDPNTPTPSDIPMPTVTNTQNPTPTESAVITSTPPNTQTPTSATVEVSDLDLSAAGTGTLFRAQVVLKYPYDPTRLAEWGINVLEQGDGWALVLVDDVQLADLARRGFEPSQINSLEYLSMASLGAMSVDALSSDEDLLLAQASIDSDGDGLTDTEEAWWCTDPLDNNSDSPEEPSETNPSDGDEVQAILNGVRAYGPPFALWPQFTPHNPDGDCPDGDYDGVPDYAEEFIIGTSQLRESSDKDKFDDGQELFGVTFCPGSAGPCGYGILPRAEDVAWVSAELPAWVLPPGDSPWVAAFPKPEVSVVPSSINVSAVTTITTERTITEGEEYTYGTATTNGTSTGITDTVTWNEWQEVSHTTYDGGATSQNMFFQENNDFDILGTIRGVNGIIEAACFVPPVGSSGVPEIDFLYEAGCFVHDAGTLIGEGINGLIYYSTLYGPTVRQTVSDVVTGVSEVIADVDEIQVDFNAIPGIDVTGTWYIGENSSYLQAQGITTSNQELPIGVGQHLYGSGNQSEIVTQQMIPAISYSFYPQESHTVSRGREWGGSQSTTTTNYHEQTISEASTNQFATSWADATAVNTAHAADLRFTYNIVNNGTEYAREVSSLIFNVYLGNDPNPIHTYVAVGDNGQISQIENFFPGDSHQFTSDPIPLTLEQMRAIDAGSSIRVVMEDIAFGQDQAFYQDALNGSVMVAMEDGFDDSDELVDTYLIPVWDPSDTVQDVLKRYFPVFEDGEGGLMAVWTPEFGEGSPSSWCQEPKTAPHSTTIYCQHALTGTSWWNLYLSEGLDYNGDFKDTLAAPNTTLLVRIISDRDLDGYNDRNEIRLGTDPDDPASHPNPELLAGYTVECSGEDCTILLSFLNTGNYDAYGVEAVMYSPDGLSEITNNTVGGSGRVPAGEQVVVGSRILQPKLGGWSGDSEPYSSGYYLGGADRTYTFTAQSDGGIGQANPVVFNWSDDLGGSGTVDFGSGYQAPLPQDINLGVQIGFQSGTVMQRDSFTVQALTPRDTFQYTVNDSNAVDPVIVVSYNDPQGNHRFILPEASNLGTHDHLSDDLSGLSGEMIPDPGVQIASTSSTQANFVINAPHPESITDGHLFVEYIDSQGNVAHEDDFQQIFLTGPTVIQVAIDLNTYPADEYILLAFFTDSQGNIIDSSARPLASFGPDPSPVANLVAEEWQVGPTAAQGVISVPDPWDFGGVEAGTVLHARVTLGNTGVGNLLYALTGYGDELTFSGAPSGTLTPTNTRTIDITLDTRDLTVGPFSNTLTVRTNDPNQGDIDINLTGTIMAPGGDATAYQVSPFRPWDQYVYVPGPLNMNDTIAFDHTILDEGARMHPLYLYDEDNTTLRGVGEFGLDFSGGYAPASVFGTGVDGDLVVSSGQTVYTDNTRSAASTTALSGQNQIVLTNISGFAVNREVLIHQTQGSGAGTFEFATITGINVNTLVLQDVLENSYTVGGNSKAQVIQVPHYRNVTLQSGGTIVAHAWDGSTGGIVAFRTQNTIDIQANAEINSSFLGFRGGSSTASNIYSLPGEGTLGFCGNMQANCGSGGGGGTREEPNAQAKNASGGGGGGNGASGTQVNQAGYDNPSRPAQNGGSAGATYGALDFKKMYLGGGGGEGGGQQGEGGGSQGGDGGRGGGIIFIASQTLNVNGKINSNGQDGSRTNWGSGGGGAGGNILLISQNATIGSNNVVSLGGNGGAQNSYGGSGGNGSTGRINIQYTSITGATNPSANTQQVNFYTLSYGSSGGTGVDGDLIVSTGQTVYTDNTRAALAINAASGQNQIALDDAIGFIENREVLIIQIQGTGAGTYEFAYIDSINSNTLTLLYNLDNSYTVDGVSTVQVIQVPNYQNVTVQSGGILTAHAWDGDDGGVVCFRASGTFKVEVGGILNATGIGFRGGLASTVNVDSYAYRGEGSIQFYNATKDYTNNLDAAGGGENERNSNVRQAGGGGGGHGTSGENGANHPLGSGTPGQGGDTIGFPDLSSIFLGAGGGAGGSNWEQSPPPTAKGGDGGGIMMIFANDIIMNGDIQANGEDGETVWGGTANGGGGAGGSILLKAGSVTLGENHVLAIGGQGGIGQSGTGGDGGEGRIRAEYCQNLSGESVPAASTEEIDCYIITHPGGSPNTEIILPDAIAAGASELYILQYGQHSNETNGGDQLFAARMPNTVYASVNISALVERVAGSGENFNFCLDIGNDGVCDWTPPQQSFSGPARLDTNPSDATTLAAALNAYILAQASSADDLLIPIRVNIDTPSDIFLFNLEAEEGQALDLVPSVLTIAPQTGVAPDNIAEGTLVDLSVTVTNNGVVPAENFTVAFYDGDPGGDGTLIGSTYIEALAAGATSPAQTVEWNTSGLLGEKTLYVMVDASGAIVETDEDNNQATADAVVRMKPDLVAESLTVPNARAGETVQAEIVVRNDGEADVFGAAINLYAGDPDTGILLGSTTIDVAKESSTTTQIAWTPASAGQHQLSIKADPADNIVEADEDNNAVAATARAGWDWLVVDAGDDGTTDITYNADAGYGWLTEGTVITTCGTNIEQSYRQVGSAETLEYQFDNLLPDRRYHLDLTFATCSGERWLNIYVNGSLVGEDFPPELALASFEPTHVTTTPQTVSILLDPADYTDGSITLEIERAEGFSGPLVNIIDLIEIEYCYRDSGPDEEAWSVENGCGYDPDWPSDGYDGWGATPEETLRFSEGGQVKYKFSGLDSAKAYNLKLTFYEEDQVGRQQRLDFDGTLSETFTLGPDPHYYVVQIPAASYSDGEVIATIERLTPSGNSAIVSEVTLEQHTRRYPGVPPDPEPTPTPTPTTEPPPASPQVELSSFSAAWNGNQVDIEWSTTTEVDNAEFVLYRSTDSLTWVEIHTEPSTRACGNYTGTEPVVYTYADTNVTPGTTYYYRLKFSGAGCGGGDTPSGMIVTALVAPEMSVTGNSQTIVDGDTTSSTSDNTNFGEVGLDGSSVTHSFTILNTGIGSLNLTGSPRIAISGLHAADFSITVQPVSSIAPGGSTTFEVTFNPGGDGLRTAFLSIENNDSNENPYNFIIQGTGVAANVIYLPIIQVGP